VRPFSVAPALNGNSISVLANALNVDFASLIQQYGYAVVFVGSVLESETLLALAGVAAHCGYLSLQWVMAVAAAGRIPRRPALFSHRAALRRQRACALASA
jgi:hypothetical protein